MANLTSAKRMKPQKKSRGHSGGRHALSSEGRKVNMGMAVLPSTLKTLREQGRPMGVIVDELVRENLNGEPRHIGMILDSLSDLLGEARKAIQREDSK